MSEPHAALPPSPSSSPPPAGPAPVNLAPVAVAAPAPALVVQAAAEPPRPILRSPWLWAAVGAVVAAGVVLIVVLNPSYPNATLGQAAVK